MRSSDGFNLHQHYIESDSISPKSNYTLTIWTEQPILKGQIIAESDYKITMNSAESNTPFIVQILWAIGISGIVMIIGSSFTLWFSKRKIMQTQNLIRETKEQSERNSAKYDELLDKVDARKKQSQKSAFELRLYYSTRISNLQRELSFWRDTVRKMLYNSQNEFQTADKLIETVTSTLETYTTRKRSDAHVDELLYLSQLIADSRELHSKHNSTDSADDS